MDLNCCCGGCIIIIKEKNYLMGFILIRAFIDNLGS